MPWTCLMYHDVLPSTAASGGGGERFAVPLSAFETMLDAILTSGRRGCALQEALRRGGDDVAITFDDGTISQLEHAVPALRDRGMSATFFVTTDWVGAPGFMGWSDLREISALGMSVQSHTKSHPFLSELDRDALLGELSASKAALDLRLEQDTGAISLPGGDAPRRHLRSLLWESGYRIVAGSRWGTNPDGLDPRHSLVRRCTMRGAITGEEARQVLAGDPWLTAMKYTREATLNRVRAALGPTRYARWRRRLLDSIATEA